MKYITETIKKQVLRTAQDLHQHPELSQQEVRTTQLLKQQLSDMNIEIVDILTGTGVIGLIRGAHPGKTVALRADIDALPVQEDPTHEVCSQNDGVMHACGHDIHTASLLGAACALQGMRHTLRGNILLIFQPAEETSTGATAVLESGIFDRVKPDAFFSLHVIPSIPAGSLGVRTGAIMAAQKGFQITVTGKGGHGSAPHNTCDPVIAAARTVDALQSIVARENDPLSPFVLSVCSFHSGNVFNIIPDTAELTGTCRFLDNTRSHAIEDRVAQIAETTAAVHSCRTKTEFFRRLPALDNDASLSPVAMAAGSRVFGPDNVFSQNTMMASEDFSLFAQVAPIFMYHVGVGGEYPLHNCHLCIPEETAVRCAELLTETALVFLEGRT